MTTSVDVLAVMKLALRHLNGGADSLTGAEHFEAHGGMKDALAAVAELIEAVEDEKYKSGPQFTCEEWLESSRRVRNALARVKGA